ncbi:MAG: primosomal protein N' [Chloroherpetonaceae bacterium]|nr:primosomal protein N' [Chloroherpetonaceae bacterium]
MKRIMKTAFVYLDQPYLEKPIRYRIPTHFNELIQVGSRVLVPFGKADKTYLGFIRSIEHSEQEETSLDEIIDVFDDGKSVFSPRMFELSEWISAYYINSPSESLGAMLPAALRIEPKETVRLKEFTLSSADESIVKTELRRKIVSELEKNRSLTIRQLEKKTGSKNLRRALSELERIGEIEIEKTHLQKGKPKTKSAYRITQTNSSTPTEVMMAEALKRFKRSKQKTAALEKLMSLEFTHYFPEQLNLKSALLRSLVKDGVLEEIKVELDRAFQEGFYESKKNFELSSIQREAVNRISNAIEKNEFRSILLHGVTGSGKTWVYIEAIRSALREGKSAIILVPEISLTPQTAARFRAEFGDLIRVLHSAMSDGEKYDAWENLRTGKASIALGPRSAIFAPLANLGLIIVDEEHEGSYKQDKPAPRYNGRDVALVRAKLEKAVCVLGSATPSIESFFNAEQSKYHYQELPTRADGAEMPELKLIWMPREKKLTPSISETLFNQIFERMKRNEQVILFQNRRGFVGSVSCYDCGHIHTCDACNVPLVYHRTQNQLQCHYCGAVKPMIRSCLRCKSENLLYKGSGTEKIETELASLFPSEKILRMDLDSTSKKGSHAKILSDFREGKSRLLLGTQMVAKGLDFPNVTLVGVLAADIGLALPDFRASERLYSLLTQVAGRAGRAEKRGEVYLQVFDLYNPVFKHFLENDYKSFYEAEKKLRSELRYPPFSRLVKVEFSGLVEQHVRTVAERFSYDLHAQNTDPRFEFLGPVPAVLEKLNNKFRYQLLIKQTDGARIQKESFKAVHRIYHERNPWKVSIAIDVDVQSMM